MFDPKIVMDNLPVIGGFLITIGLFYKAWSETRRMNKEAELKNKREELELSQLAAKFNIETVTGATTSAVSVLTSIADRLKSQLDDSDKEIVSLKAARTARDEQFAEMEKKQAALKTSQETATRQLGEMATEMQRLREDNQAKDEVIHKQGETIESQGKQIAHLEEKVNRLEEYIKENGLSLPDGWEHGDVKKENGGGTG